MTSSLPPDGFADDQGINGPPDGFADQQINSPSTTAPSFKTKNQASKFLPLFSQVGMKGMDMVQNLANKGGEVAAENLASGVTPKVNPLLPFPLNVGASSTPGKGLRLPPSIAAGVGTALQIAPDVAASAIPGIGEENAGSNAAQQAPNFFQRLGARETNNAIGITPRTLGGIAGSKNPAQVGEAIGTRLGNEGAIGSSGGSTFDKVSALHQRYGQQVGDAIDAIKNAGGQIELGADQALQPLVDQWTQFKNSALSVNQRMTKPFEQIYGKLAQTAQSKGGTIGLDDIRSAMDEVGDALSGLKDGSPGEAAYSRLYGTLAQMRDQVVNSVAQGAGNPDLTKNLLQANEGYSLYSRILPDVRRAAAKEGVGATAFSNLFKHPIDTTANALRPLFAKTLTRLGKPNLPVTFPTSATLNQNTEPDSGIIQYSPLFKKAANQ